MVELMLAMSFVSVLLVAIAMTVIQISNIYQRGLTLKEVDQAGRALASEFQKNIGEGNPFELVTCGAPSSTTPCNYVNVAWGGRLCIGLYSYVWNYGITIKNNIAPINKTVAGKVIRFAKVIDPNADYCAHQTKAIVDNDATELLSVSQHYLAVHKFSIINLVVDNKTQQRLYNVDFLLGTSDRTGTTDNSIQYTPDATCKPPSVLGSNTTYCSINKFSVLIRTGGVSK